MTIVTKHQLGDGEKENEMNMKKAGELVSDAETGGFVPPPSRVSVAWAGDVPAEWYTHMRRRRLLTSLCFTLLVLWLLMAAFIGGVLFYRHLHRRPTFYGWCGTSFEEHGQAERLEQRLEIDPDEMYERIEVPKFGGNRPAVFVHDFRQVGPVLECLSVIYETRDDFFLGARRFCPAYVDACVDGGTVQTFGGDRRPSRLAVGQRRLCPMNRPPLFALVIGEHRRDHRSCLSSRSPPIGAPAGQSENLTAIVDVLADRCFVKELDRSHVAPPTSFIDLVQKMENGYYEQNPRVIRESYRVGYPLNKDDLDALGSYMISKQCSDRASFMLRKTPNALERPAPSRRHKRGTDRAVKFSSMNGDIVEINDIIL
uniref:BRICHOS domain-containing protein n=1 Tax=Plectus sambesii TaxID=2011161 RepID=A0A914WE70_9BILA